jgi:hypothetical protein
LHFPSFELLGIANAIDTRELQHHAALVEPVLFQLQFAAAAILGKSPQLTTLLEAVWEVRVQFRQNFASPPLRAQDARDGNEFAAYSTISNW